ncbi:MAG: DUF4843 domain-containing protein, partial [Bacteroidetes bacterium]|nr:DUF4843 domain-containing protein [Bacteroidota bacterium]
GVLVVDNLNEIKDEEFIDQDWTTEHYTETGRKLIAKNVASALKGFYPEQFADVKYSDEKQANFFNDGEKQTVWGQMQTLSTERAYSGKYASKVGGENDYGLTFEYPFAKIPDSLKREISIGMKFFQDDLNHKAQLVIQAQKGGKDVYWQAINLVNNVPETGEWADFEYNLLINKEIETAEIIKIYLYNPSDKVVFLDDFRIDFR